MSKGSLSRLALIVLAPLVCATVGHAQAAAEYALRSAGSAVSTGANATIGGCRVDSALFTCLGQSYPKTTVVVIILLTLMILRWLTRAYRSRA